MYRNVKYKTEQNSNPGLTLIDISGTGPWFFFSVFSWTQAKSRSLKKRKRTRPISFHRDKTS